LAVEVQHVFQRKKNVQCLRERKGYLVEVFPRLHLRLLRHYAFRHPLVDLEVQHEADQTCEQFRDLVTLQPRKVEALALSSFRRVVAVPHVVVDAFGLEMFGHLVKIGLARGSKCRSIFEEKGGI
jgi:hypothetical protein